MRWYSIFVLFSKWYYRENTERSTAQYLRWVFPHRLPPIASSLPTMVRSTHGPVDHHRWPPPMMKCPFHQRTASHAARLHRSAQRHRWLPQTAFRCQLKVFCWHDKHSIRISRTTIWCTTNMHSMDDRMPSCQSECYKQIYRL